MGKILTFIKKYRFIGIITTIVIVTVLILGKKYVSKSTDSASVRQTTLAEAVIGDITEGISASGTVETANYLPITTSVNGIVKEVFVREGDNVTKGQRIMEITLNSDGEEVLSKAYSAYLSAKNSLEKAKTDLKAKEKSLIEAEEAFRDEKESNSYQSRDERISYSLLENDYIVAKESYEQQSNIIKQNEIALNNAWLTYKAQSPTILASDSGVVANILVVEGMDITNSLSERTSTSVASIKKEGNPIISLNITELDINNVKVGQRVLIDLNSIPNKTFSGSVVGVDKIGTVSNGVTNYTVIVRFDESSDQVLPNMGVDGKIIKEEKKNVLLVPSSAVISTNRQKFVTTVKNGAEERVTVEVGITDGLNTEIISGLNEGDRVVVQSLPTSGFSDTQNRPANFRGPGGVFIR